MAVVSSLAKGLLQSPNCSSRNGEKVSKITIHHMAGFMSAKQCAELFLKESRKASSNYCVDDSEIWCSCSEDLRAWTSGSGENDRKAITFEVKNSTGAPDWKISDATYNNMIALCVDICKRYNISKLYFTGDKTGTLTYHYMFQNTLCPGPFIKSLTQKICDDVNAQLGNVPTPKPEIPAQPIKSNLEVAREIWYGVNGKNPWGNGAERKQKLEAAGYVYTEVQSLVNQLAHKMIK